MFIHHVYFWLKTGTPVSARDALIVDCQTVLAAIPGVRQLYAGVPAMTEREVVDNTYDVGLCVILDDEAAHDVYQTHDLHLQFIARNKHHWDRVRVYDFLS